MKTDAILSDCELYRYSLTRNWAHENESIKTLMIVGLNPSTADATLDDPTIRRCIGFAKSFGMNQLIMTNLFAFRSTDPDALSASGDPIGPKNDEYIETIAKSADMILVAWGSHDMVHLRKEQVLKYLRDPKCLGFTKYGHPRHPLYVKGDTLPVDFK